jgi:hypothetical protein
MYVDVGGRDTDSCRGQSIAGDEIACAVGQIDTGA